MKDLLFDRVAEYAAEYKMLPRDCHVTVAVSGGLDSMCLLHILSVLAVEKRFSVSAAHFNHHIRGDEAARDEAFVRDWCKTNGISLVVGQGDVPFYARENRLSLEEAGRILRYRFLQEISPANGRIATAHTASDNAETVLWNLTRGTGLQGLCGIPPVRDNIIRPLLEITREELEQYASRSFIPHVEDSTNEKDSYTRNKIRHQVIPVLQSINPDFLHAVSRNSRIIQQEASYIEQQAEHFLNGQSVPCTLSVPLLAELPPYVRARVFQKICMGRISQCHILSLENLCRDDTAPSAALSLPGLVARREYDELIIEEPQSVSGFEPFTIACGQTVECEALGLRFSCTEVVSDKIKSAFSEEYLFNFRNVCGKITVRSRVSGDSVRFFGQTHTKSIKKLFIDAHIPARKRALVPILADDLGIIAVYGFGIASRVAPGEGEKTIKITIEENKLS